MNQTNEDRIIEIAQRGQDAPESLTEDEIRIIALDVLSGLQGGDYIKAETPEQN